MQGRNSQVRSTSLGYNLFELISEEKWQAAKWCVDQSKEAPEELKINYSEKNYDDISYLIICLEKTGGLQFINNVLLPLWLNEISNQKEVLQSNLFDYDEKGRNCFHLLAEIGDTALFLKLAEIVSAHFPEMVPPWIDTDNDERTPLHIAVCYNRADIIESYFQLSGSELMVNACDKNLDSAIHLTTHGKIISLLIKQGANIALPNNANQTLIERWFRGDIFDRYAVLDGLNKQDKIYFFCWARNYCRKNPSNENKKLLSCIASKCSLQTYLLSKIEFGRERQVITGYYDVVSDRCQYEKYFIKDLDKSRKLIQLFDVYYQDLLLRGQEHAADFKKSQLIKKVMLSVLVISLYGAMLGFLSKKADVYSRCQPVTACNIKAPQYFIGSLLFGLFGCVAAIGVVAVILSCKYFSGATPHPVRIANDESLNKIKYKLNKYWILPLANVPVEDQFITHAVVRELKNMYAILSDEGLTDFAFKANKSAMMRSLKAFKAELYASGRSLTLFSNDKDNSYLEDEIVNVSDDEVSINMSLISSS